MVRADRHGTAPAGKGAKPKGPGGRNPSGRTTAPVSNRYTPPIPKEQKVSPRWVPVTMFTFLVLGMAVIVINYLPGHILPGSPSNYWLLAGLGMITGGFIAATQYR